MVEGLILSIDIFGSVTVWLVLFSFNLSDFTKPKIDRDCGFWRVWELVAGF